MTIEIHTTSEPVSIGINPVVTPVSVGLNPQETPVVSIGTNPILGPKGDKGDTGEQGPKGDTGEKGDKGDKGDTGSQGPKGDTGNSGVQISTTQPTDPNINVWLNPDGIVGNVSAFVNDAGYITKSVNNLDNYTLTSALSTVATSGSYEDLSEKPTIPTKTSDLTNDSEFITSSYHDSSKQDVISDLSTIRTNATNGQSAYTTISGYGNIVTHNTNEFATSSQGSLADTALQPNDNISELTNDAGYITGITSSDVTTALGFTPYNSTNPSGYQTASQVSTSISSYHDTTKYDASNPNGYTSNVGTITGITMNGASKGTSGVVDLGTVITSLSGYATESFVTSQGYITGINSTMVITALGYTPYNSTNPDGYITSSAITGKENTSNKVTSISSSSTDTQYPSAKCVYDIVGNIEATLQAIRGV